MKTETQHKIVNSLYKKNVKKPCSQCDHNDYVVIDGYFNFSLNGFEDSCIPCVGILCKNCGNINFHALGMLDMIKEIIYEEE